MAAPERCPRTARAKTARAPDQGSRGRTAGEFDALEGAGRPLTDLDEPYDEFWWVKRKLRREQLSFVPDAIGIRREAEVLLEGLARIPTEQEARALLLDLNARIARTNAATVTGT